MLTNNFLDHTAQHPYQEKEVEIEDIDDESVERAADSQDEEEVERVENEFGANGAEVKLDQQELERLLQKEHQK